METTELMQLTFTLKITNPQFVKTSVIVNSPFHDYAHQDDHGFKLFTLLNGKIRLKTHISPYFQEKLANKALMVVWKYQK